MGDNCLKLRCLCLFLWCEPEWSSISMWIQEMYQMYPNVSFFNFWATATWSWPLVSQCAGPKDGNNRRDMYLRLSTTLRLLGQYGQYRHRTFVHHPTSQGVLNVCRKLLAWSSMCVDHVEIDFISYWGRILQFSHQKTLQNGGLLVPGAPEVLHVPKRVGKNLVIRIATASALQWFNQRGDPPIPVAP